MTDIVAALLRANLAGSLVILAVLALRLPARRWLGPEAAYGLWAAPLTAALATFLPARLIATAPHLAVEAGEGAFAIVLVVWLIGLIITAGLLALAQAAFLRARKAGRAGPAVLGVIRPRVVMPRDERLYTPEERALVRAHEREHIARHDPRASAIIAVVQCFAWFNPLVHIAARLVRLDQELACDAAVLRRHPGQNALYAGTLLKTQLAATPLPFGCYWPSRGAHPLEVRIGLMRRAVSVSAGGPASMALVAAGVAAASCIAWTAQPPQAASPTYVWPVLPMVLLLDLGPAPFRQVDPS